MSRAENYRLRWLRHRRVLENLLKEAGDIDVNFVPWDEGFPLGKLVTHTVGATDMFVKAVQNGGFAKPEQREHPANMEELLNVVRSATEDTNAVFKTLDDEDLEKEVAMNEGRKMSGSGWLSTAIDHEVHHKGQLYTYVRMAGATGKLPFFLSPLAEEE